jgi:hypothetical protein
MTEEETISDEFTKVIKDLIGDLKITFPEYIPLVKKWWKDVDDFAYIDDSLDGGEERNKAFKKTEKQCIKIVFRFCQKKLPPRFFDILYENADIFKVDSEIDTEFLPTIHFKNLWNSDITDKTRATLWKYLQLMLFSIVSTLDNKEAFGDTAKLFEAIDQTEFNQKLQETILQMQGLFESSPNASESTNTGESSGEPTAQNYDLPNPDDIQSHIEGMLHGKLGQLAREIAEETAQDLGDLGGDEITDMKDVFTKLIKDPTKLMGLVKSVSSKLDTKIKSGELKESELIAEATELMNKMKSMPGMGNIQGLMAKMGLSGGGAKVNTGAMEAQLNRNMKYAKTKERILAKSQAAKEKRMLEEMQKKVASEANQSNATKSPISEEELIKIFSVGEKQPKTARKDKRSEPVIKQSEPVIKQSEPIIKQSEPVIKQSEPVIKQSEPVITHKTIPSKKVNKSKK